MRRPSPLYVLAGLLAIATIVFAFATTSAPTASGRTGSVYDDGPGGAAALRRYLEAMGATTTAVQGDRFAPDASAASVLFILGATEAMTPTDADNVKKFVVAGGRSQKPCCTLKVALQDSPFGGLVTIICREGLPFPSPCALKLTIGCPVNTAVPGNRAARVMS